MKSSAEAQKSFSSNKLDTMPEPIIKLGPVEHISLILAQASCESGVETFFEIDGVGKIFGKGGRFIGTLTEEELKLFYRSVPLHIEAPTNQEVVQ